jgi:predicted enzyme related to lactoylglutathione lyase
VDLLLSVSLLLLAAASYAREQRLIRLVRTSKTCQGRPAMADKTVRGRFVWHELRTPDAEAAHGFYTRVLGWKTQPWEQDPSYTMFAAASGPLGGTWPLDSGQPHWITYIGTEDIQATVRQAQELGGRVTKEITSMPNGGQYALLEDPQGAAFGVYASASESAAQKAPKRGEYSWHELATNDYQAAFDFYSALFGWEEVGKHEMGAPHGTYFMFGRNGTPMGGIFNRMREMPPPAWLGYVRVKDVQQVVKKVKSAGGTLLTGPMEVPGGDWIAQFTDPNGAMFAAHALAADVKGSEETARDEQGSVTPQEAGAKRQKEAQAAKQSGATARAGAAKRAGKSAAKAGAKQAKKVSKKGGKAAKKKALKSATKAKAAKKPAQKKSAAKKAAKTRSATRASKRPARKAKVKRTAQRAPARKPAKRARRAK